MLRALVKLALTYAVTKALTRAGGPGGVIDSVLSSNRKRGGQKRQDGRRRRH